jgi:hypothetical protein
MTDAEPPAGSLRSPPTVMSERDPVPPHWRPTVAGTVSVVALLHLLFLWGNRGPVLYQDALGYLGNARFLAGGTPPHFDGTGYYNVGYSLLLVPIYWVTQQSGIVWAAAVLINVFLAVAILLPSYFLARRLFTLPRRQALLVAVATSLTPALLLQPGRIWVETIFPFVFLATAVLLLLTVDTKRGIFAFGTGLASGYLILIHGRGFAVLAALILILLTGYALRELRFRLVAFTVAGAAIGIVVDRILRSYLMAHLWTATAPHNANPVQNMLDALAPYRLHETSATLLGHIWYVVVTTFGIAIVGFVALLIIAYRCRRFDSDRTRMLVALFLVLSVAGAAVLSSSFLANATRLDARVYGRYLEGFTPVLILAGVAWTLAQRKAWRITAIAAVSLPAFGLALVSMTGPDAMTGNAIKLTIPGLLGLQTIVSGSGGTWVHHVDVVAISLLAAFVGGLVALAAWWRTVAGAAAIVVFTVAVTFIGKTTSWDPFVSFFFNEFNDIPTALQELPEHDPVAYDRSFFLVDSRNLYEFRLAPRRLAFVDDACEVHPGDVVISTSDPDLLVDGFTLIAADGVPKQGLWFVEDPAAASCQGAGTSTEE